MVVLRNPKDMLVSYYHFYKVNKDCVGDYTATFDQFFEAFKGKFTSAHCVDPFSENFYYYGFILDV